jgi:glycerophosphoryl diester phosphodiesterase
VQAKEPTVIDAAFVKAVRDANLALLVWTVDDPALARKMVDLGVDAITTNRGQWMAEQLGMK